MRALRLTVAVLATTVALCFMTVANASVIGDLQTSSGSGTVTVTLSSITFNPDGSAKPPGPPWNGEVTNATDLMFSGCPSGVLGTAGCLDSGGLNAEGVEFADNNPIVLGAGLAANNPFIQFAGNGTAHATILYTIAGAGPGSSNTNCAGLTPGESCSIFAGSPVILTDTATGTSISFSTFGTVTDGAGVSNWAGGFSTPISGMSPEQIQQFFCPETATGGVCSAADFASGKQITKPTGGDFIANSVPEPATTAMMLVGIGLIGLGRIRRHRAKS